MHSSVRLGRIAGIPVELHVSWFIIAALIALSLARHFAMTSDWGWFVVSIASITTALLFFAALVGHEMAHAIVAQSYGLPIRSITLFALGGVAHIDREADRPGVEFWVAIAGPIASVMIGLTCVMGARALGWSIGAPAPGALAAMLGWLGSINIVLAVFNLLPGYPLDGGRLLRAFLWAATKDEAAATLIVTMTGQAVAMILMVLGVLQFLRGSALGGLWIVFVGFFLLHAARSRQMHLRPSAPCRT
jgi:Zn-dependent protease